MSKTERRGKREEAAQTLNAIAENLSLDRVSVRNVRERSETGKKAMAVSMQAT